MNLIISKSVNVLQRVCILAAAFCFAGQYSLSAREAADFDVTTAKGIEVVDATANAELYDEVAHATAKQILMCDFATNFSTPEYPRGMWQTYPTEVEAADAYGRYLEQGFSRPYLIGVHRCTYIDLPRGKVLKQGLIRQCGRPYERTVQRYAEIHKALYEQLYEAASRSLGQTAP